MENLSIKELKDICLIFNQFSFDNFGMPPQLLSAYQESNKLIEEAYVKNQVKPLKAMLSDINEQIRNMPLKTAVEIKELIKDKLNIEFEIVDKLRLKAIEKILKQGKIVKPEEYELLLSRVDEIYADPEKSGELNQLNKLLAEYEI